MIACTRLMGPLTLLLGAALGAAAQAQTTAIRAASFVDPSGALVPDCLIVVQDGRITQVGGSPPAGAVVVEYADSVIGPGLVDVQSALTAQGQTGEFGAAIEPDATAQDVLNRYSPQLRAALSAGVTTFALAPDDSSLIGGQIAVVQTGAADGQPHVRTADGPLKLSISPAVLSAIREPTARSGALAMLREALARPPADSASPLARLVAGQLPGIIAAPAGADVLSALGLAAQYKVNLTLIHTIDALDVATPIAGAKRPVIVGPLALTSGERELRAAGVLERAGATVAIAGGLPLRSPESLRIGAALAVRFGMSDTAARCAITRIPAELLGVGDQVGSIAVGRRADLLVFSGDPLDLRSRLRSVCVDGVVVWSSLP